MKSLSLIHALAVTGCIILASGHVFADTATAPDNTANNQRDRNSAAVTAGSQAKGSKSDVETTRQIRRALTKDDSLSTYAKNIKIVTLDGVVNLRGPVHSDAEKTKVATIAQNVIGANGTLNNDLDVKN